MATIIITESKKVKLNAKQVAFLTVLRKMQESKGGAFDAPVLQAHVSKEYNDYESYGDVLKVLKKNKVITVDVQTGMNSSIEFTLEGFELYKQTIAEGGPSTTRASSLVRPDWLPEVSALEAAEIRLRSAKSRLEMVHLTWREHPGSDSLRPIYQRAQTYVAKRQAEYDAVLIDPKNQEQSNVDDSDALDDEAVVPEEEGREMQDSDSTLSEDEQLAQMLAEEEANDETSEEVTDGS